MKHMPKNFSLPEHLRHQQLKRKYPPDLAAWGVLVDIRTPDGNVPSEVRVEKPARLDAPKCPVTEALVALAGPSGIGWVFPAFPGVVAARWSLLHPS